MIERRERGDQLFWCVGCASLRAGVQVDCSSFLTVFVRVISRLINSQSVTSFSKLNKGQLYWCSSELVSDQ